MDLKYTPLEKIHIKKPVNRLAYVSNLCQDKKVLDIGCYDETAIDKKRNTNFWLHGLITEKAQSVIGIDSSDLIKEEIKTGNNAKIIKLNSNDIDEDFARKHPIDIIIAGEFIEHIEDIQSFIRNLKLIYPGIPLVLTTPNSTSLTNFLLALINRESNHEDHVHIFSYKTLHTICKRAKVKNFTIRPYKVSYGEMYLKSNGIKKILVKSVESLINTFEYLFPMTSGGYIVEIVL